MDTHPEPGNPAVASTTDTAVHPSVAEQQASCAVRSTNKCVSPIDSIGLTITDCTGVLGLDGTSSLVTPQAPSPARASRGTVKTNCADPSNSTRGAASSSGWASVGGGDDDGRREVGGVIVVVTSTLLLLLLSSFTAPEHCSNPAMAATKSTLVANSPNGGRGISAVNIVRSAVG